MTHWRPYLARPPPSQRFKLGHYRPRGKGTEASYPKFRQGEGQASEADRRVQGAASERFLWHTEENLRGGDVEG